MLRTLLEAHTSPPLTTEAAEPGRATSPSAPKRSLSAGTRALLRAASPRALSRSGGQFVGRRKVTRWLNDNAVFSLSLTGGAEEDELALVEFMLLRPGEAAPLPFAMTASQSDAFFHG